MIRTRLEIDRINKYLNVKKVRELYFVEFTSLIKFNLA